MGYPRRDECSHIKYAYWLCQHIVNPSQVPHIHIYYIPKFDSCESKITFKVLKILIFLFIFTLRTFRTCGII